MLHISRNFLWFCGFLKIISIFFIKMHKNYVRSFVHLEMIKRRNDWGNDEELELKGKIMQIATKRYSMQDGRRNIKEGKAETLSLFLFPFFLPRCLLNSRLISFTVLIPYSWAPPFSWLRPHQSSSDHSSRQPDHFSFPDEHQKSCEPWRFIHHYADVLTSPSGTWCKYLEVRNKTNS